MPARVKKTKASRPSRASAGIRGKNIAANAMATQMAQMPWLDKAWLQVVSKTDEAAEFRERTSKGSVERFIKRASKPDAIIILYATVSTRYFQTPDREAVLWAARQIVKDGLQSGLYMEFESAPEEIAKVWTGLEESIAKARTTQQREVAQRAREYRSRDLAKQMPQVWAHALLEQALKGDGIAAIKLLLFARHDEVQYDFGRLETPKSVSENRRGLRGAVR